MEYKIQYKFSVLHWTLRSAKVIEHPYIFTGNTAVHRAHWPLGIEKSGRHLEPVVFLMWCTAAVDVRALSSIFLFKLADYRSGNYFSQVRFNISVLLVVFCEQNIPCALYHLLPLQQKDKQTKNA